MVLAGSLQSSLQLGNFIFSGFEVPNDLPNLFGEQKMAVHDFAGGDRTVQTLGAFPFDFIEWKGSFFQGNDLYASPDIVARASQLNTMRTMGTVENLIWGAFNYMVLVREFEIIGVMAQQLDYRIKILPIFDKTSTSNMPASQGNPTALVASANLGVTHATTSPIGTLLPPIIKAAASVVTSSVTAAIISSSGNVSTLNATQQAVLQGQIAALQLSLSPIINGSDYGQASAAAILSSSLYTLSSTLGIEQAVPVAILTVTNPNLPALASQYYGDSSLWPLIAQANNFQDMFVTGTYTVTIPAQSTQSNFIPSS